eukprot:CCRYP_002772-RA/>CCRYP_002772-RA protein AED:0.36 eAED:0.36 QI:0/-1/0/1/-1/1/1/0/463
MIPTLYDRRLVPVTITGSVYKSGGIHTTLSLCNTLVRHVGGGWSHQRNVTLDPTASHNYLPREMDWLRGTSKEWTTGCRNHDLRGHIYASPMGNQCGCGTTGFEPADSQWIWDAEENVTASSPSFQLVERLAKSKQTMCFAGDSIDLQFYFAIVNNLFRIRLLHHHDAQRPPFDRLANITIQQSQIPVVYSNATTGPTDYSKYWMCMKDILETIVTLDYKDGESHNATLRFFKVYGWSPWNFLLMDDCDILIYTLGIHYNAQAPMTENHYGGNQYADDFSAAVTFLAGFAASGEKKVAIWRSTLPQHFDSANGDGHYPSKGSGCVPLPEGAVNRLDVTLIQNFNRASEEGFAKHCNVSMTTPCDELLRHTCTMNATATNCRTVYKHLVDNNLTDLADAVRRRGDLVKGEILRWNIADLFNVPQWHSSDSDCSHFCYIPALYEEAFRRLDLLLLWANLAAGSAM